MWVFAGHSSKVLNYMKPTNTSVINGIHLREAMQELDLPPEWAEFTIAVVVLTNNKAPGLNGVPPNSFKAMTEENLLHLFDFILEFWEDRLDFVEWHEGQVVLVPKIGDLSDPNKWRGVNLMDIGARVFNSMMFKRLFKVIKSYGYPTQFGSSPGVGCQDGQFFIKTAIHARHKHNLGTYVDFVDLVKAFNTVSRAMLILEQYGVPHKFRSAIERM